MKARLFTVIGLLLVALTQQAHATPIFADIFVGSNGTSFGSGDVTGAADNGGIFLGNPARGQYLEVGFSTAITDGAGDDIRIWDIEGFSPDNNETADVFGSSDGSIFTLLGSVTGGNAAGYVDIDGAMAGPISFLRIVQTSTADAIDIDAVEAFHYAEVAVSEPGTLALFGMGLIGFLAARRKTV